MKKENKFLKVLKVVFNIVITVVLLAVLGFSVLTVLSERNGGESPLGLKIYIVMSNSMIPTFSAGSVIIAKKTPIVEIVERDVITFKVAGELETGSGQPVLVSHRVTKINSVDGQILLTTQGDYVENSEDPNPVIEENLVGKMVFFPIPILGFVLADIRNGYFIIAATVLVVLLMMMPYIIGEEE